MPPKVRGVFVIQFADSDFVRQVPTNLTVWQWAFENVTNSPTQQHKLGKVKRIGRYENAITKESLDFHQVKDKASRLSATLVREYGLVPGTTVSLFSTNTIW